MKKIRKIAASLMAIGITAAGMGSIIAHAQYQSQKVYFSNPNKYLTATVVYTRGTDYTVGTTGSDYQVVDRRVSSWIKHTEGWLYAPNDHAYSYQGNAYMGFHNIPSYISVTQFHSDHSARYKYNNQIKSHTYNIT